MPQFIITAKDYTDHEAPARRMQVRPLHLKRMKAEKQQGIFITGGATFTNKGNMNGSVLIIEIESMDIARQWVQADPYVAGKVWELIEITPFKIVQV